MKNINLPDKTNELLKRLFVLSLVIFVYLLGQTIPLYGVESDSTAYGWWNAQTMITSILNGPKNKATLMSLGMAPYINASIIVGMVAILRNAEAKARVSRRRIRRWTGVLTFFISFLSALAQTEAITYYSYIVPIKFMRGVVIAEMLFGVAVIFFIIEMNKNYGVGGMTPIIFLNVCRSMITTAQEENVLQYGTMCSFCIFVMFVVFVSESYMVKIPLQRVSIHNIHADKNFLAFKLNPIGMIPVMFSTAVFIGLKFIVEFVQRSFPDDVHWQRINEGFVMTKMLGAHIFVAIIVILAIGFSYVLLSPTDLSRQLMKSGDSVVGIPAGKRTRKYLRTRLFWISLNSGAVQGFCMGISLHLVLVGKIPETIAMLPMNVMLLTSFILTIVQELKSYYLYDAYRFFL